MVRPCRKRSFAGLWPCALLASLLAPSTARAGGFELPDLGTQALGRGGAFVAKADDPTAIYYNPAGLARQRGTHLLVNGNLYLHSFSFQRAGRYPDNPSDPLTPWGRTTYDPVQNIAGPYFAPFVALTSDFGTFDRLTGAIGFYTPSSVDNRVFRSVVNGNPSSSRYDFIRGGTSYLHPTASLSYRVLPWLDVGVSGHLILAHFNPTWTALVDDGQCPNVEYQPCDSRATVDASGMAFAATIGVMARPLKSVELGLSVRTPTSFEANGTFSTTRPDSLQQAVPSSNATVYSRLPPVVRLGGRYFKKNGTFEVYDLELDAVYEGWSLAQGDGVRIDVPKFGTYKPLAIGAVRGYRDTIGLRAGGAYNFDLQDSAVSLRGGGFYDAGATEFAYTRIDYDTLAKIGGTLGIGYRMGAYSLNAAYAAVASIPRVVGSGEGRVRPMNLARGGRQTDSKGDTLAAINEGAYRGFTHIFSIGLTISLDEVFGFSRPNHHFGTEDEEGYVAPPPSTEAPKEEKEEESSEPEPSEPKPSEEAPKKRKHDPDDPWS